MATQPARAAAFAAPLRPDLAAAFRCMTVPRGKAAPRPTPAAGILAELAAQGRPQ
jgi:hypothetical protein